MLNNEFIYAKRGDLMDVFILIRDVPVSSDKGIRLFGLEKTKIKDKEVVDKSSVFGGAN